MATPPMTNAADNCNDDVVAQQELDAFVSSDEFVDVIFTDFFPMVDSNSVDRESERSFCWKNKCFFGACPNAVFLSRRKSHVFSDSIVLFGLGSYFFFRGKKKRVYMSPFSLLSVFCNRLFWGEEIGKRNSFIPSKRGNLD